MSILYRYLTLQFFKYFGIVQLVVTFIFIVIDFISNIGRFIKADIAFSRAFFYISLKIPYMIVLLMPVSAVLAILIVLGIMNRNNEILALRSCGISTSYLIKPILVIGILLTLALFLVNEALVPATKSMANYIKRVEIKKKAVLTTREKNIWIKGNRQIIHVKAYHPAEQTISGVTVYFFDSDFRLERRIDALKGVFRKGKWTLHQSIQQQRDPKTGGYDIQFFNQHSVSLGLDPQNLTSVVKKSEELSFQELLNYIRKVEAEGYDAEIYKVDLHGKAAFPFVCLIMCMVGTGIAIRSGVRDRLALSIVYGLGACFFYWILYSFCLSLGYGGVIPPFAAAWATNLIFLCFASLTLMQTD